MGATTNPNSGRAAYNRRPGRSSKFVSRLTRLAIYLRSGFICAYCGANLAALPPNALTLDHVRPRSKGGSNAPSNLILACARCNFSRKNRPVKRYATPAAYAFINRVRRRKLNLPLARAVLSGAVPRSVAALENVR